MVNLGRENIYTLYELEKQKPTGYQLVEKNHRYKKPPKCDRYKIVDIIEDVGIYDYISLSHSNALAIEGMIIIEMVRPET